MLKCEPNCALNLSGISKRYGAGKTAKWAVKNVSFDIRQGEIVGFLGPNGAGKTSCLRMALGLIVPDTGTISLLGGEPGPRHFGRIGFLPEERGLYRKSTARASIAHMARLNGLSAKLANRRADELLQAHGLGDIGRKKVKALSKGMAQKVQLIAAIAHDPEFLILDEPFSGLDPVNQNQLEQIIRDIAARGRTIIFSTHVMEHAERLCDRIILMSGGQKIFDGSVSAALQTAPRRLILELPELSTRMSAPDWLAAFAQNYERLEAGRYNLDLRDDISSQDVLDTVLSKGLTLRHFEPQRATLHDAFVHLIAQRKGDDKSGDKSGAQANIEPSELDEKIGKSFEEKS